MPAKTRLAALALLTAACAALPARAAPAWSLPPSVATALADAHVPQNALALWVQPVDAPAPSWGWNADFGVNPASVFKLVTTSAALDTLGPAWTWKTGVYVTGPVRNGVLEGSVAIVGSGDPSLVMERVWLLLRQLRDAGVRDIRGDIVLDHAGFAPSARSAADFDGAPSEPYNVLPDALLMNFRALTLSFHPEPGGRAARVTSEPPLAGFKVDATVPLSRAACGDWRGALKLAADDPAHWRFAGAYPAACGERNWPLAYPEPASYENRLVGALWHELGGKLSGTVRAGTLPEGATLAFMFESPQLAQVVRDINKFSNNTMAEQLFLTLARLASPESAGPAVEARPEQAQAVLSQWLHARLGAAADGVVIVNGSGLARETRISARTLGALLQCDWNSAAMPELLSSLPIAGVDGTLRRSRAEAGRAHLKTGSMRDVAAVAGYVLSDNGRRYILVAIVNDPNAGAARPALDAAIEWVARDPAQAAKAP
ncbi:MAG TPA: D-alanyl-D-alanine carboxypeptidase/D-alanyl-D-alanine-endopeptidase [Burkholderiaceae bacterium]|jgi:D-alanyl-D-alanine carboxypeptidase/D-alanyl-D-alanine-endopeptidase (penicillin-binding protein 4)|nr:D-alanyl-D-alanine carboxypeptidase/D-alanyl-D-alanine-endopeptidase [Burkholderiaceae bacterium]